MGAFLEFRGAKAPYLLLPSVVRFEIKAVASAASLCFMSPSEIPDAPPQAGYLRVEFLNRLLFLL